ncbi:MAG: thiamine diphosphokinase [Pseudomonadota bacterium]
MKRFRYARPVLLAGGGVLEPDMIEAAREVAIRLDPAGLGAVIAADGAADRLSALGVRPDAIIGDMDSLTDPDAWASAGTEVLHLAEQDTTDFEKCLYSVEAPLYLAVGFTGRRTDHMLAVFHTLFARRAQRVVLIGEEEVIALSPPGERIALSLGRGARVSLFPLARVRCGPSAGLVWPTDGLTMAPGQAIGTSNRAAEDEVVLQFEDPGMLLMLERRALEALVDLFWQRASTEGGAS